MKARLLLLLGIGCLFVPVFDHPPLESGAYVQRVIGDGAVVAMITAESTELQLELRGGEQTRRIEESGSRRRHVFEIEGLQPDRRYEFTVLDRHGDELDRGSFRSAPDSDAAPVHFAVIGDSGRRPVWRAFARSPVLYLPARWNWLPPRGDLRRTSARIAENDPDFWLHVGDVVYYEGEHRYYEASFFRPFAELLRRSPGYAVIGNHDRIDDEGRQLMKNFILPENPVTGDGRYFSFGYGPVRVIGLDLDGVEDAEHPALRYLEGEMRRASEPWLVVFAHYPFYSASRQGDRAQLKEHLVPLLRRHQVDLYFSGHDHNYQRFTGDVIQVISGGGGKNLYELVEHPALVEARKEFHFCSVEVNGAELVLQAIGNDSGMFDELKLHKRDRPERLDALRELNPDRHRRITALLR